MKAFALVCAAVLVFVGIGVAAISNTTKPPHASNGIIIGTATACFGIPPRTPPLVKVEAKLDASVVVRQTVRSGSAFRFTVKPGTYTILAVRVPEDRPVSVTVVAGQTARANPLTNYCK